MAWHRWVHWAPSSGIKTTYPVKAFTFIYFVFLLNSSAVEITKQFSQGLNFIIVYIGNAFVSVNSDRIVTYKFLFSII